MIQFTSKLIDYATTLSGLSGCQRYTIMSRTTSSKTKEQAESCLGRVPAKPEKCFVWPQDDLQLEKLEATEAAIRRAVGSWTIVRKVLVSDDNDLDSWIINLSLEQAEKVRELKCVSQFDNVTCVSRRISFALFNACSLVER